MRPEARPVGTAGQDPESGRAEGPGQRGQVAGYACTRRCRRRLALIAWATLVACPGRAAGQPRADAWPRAAVARPPEPPASAPQPPPDPVRGGRVGARHFLLAGAVEPAGFGAYTYLLLQGAPSDAERPRHLQVLATLMRELPALADALRHTPPAGINLVMLPLRHVPTLPLRPESAPDDLLLRAAEDLLAAYDHARAQALLARLAVQPAGSGPVLVTLLAPAPLAAAGAPVLLEDMGQAAPALARAWMRFALRNSSRPQAWSASALSRSALNVRNLIAQLARAVPGGEPSVGASVTLAQLGR